MTITSEQISQMERIYRLNLINGMSGIRQAFLVGTRSKEGTSNLAIFNSVVHIGSNPPLLGMIFRPVDEVRRDTFNNIQETGFYSLNQVPLEMVRSAHQTSAKYEEGLSEFDACGFEEEMIEGYHIPVVKESPVRLIMKKESEQTLPNGTTLMIGSVQLIDLYENLLNAEGHLDLEKAHVAGVCGLNTYYNFKKLASFRYARP